MKREHRFPWTHLAHLLPVLAVLGLAGCIEDEYWIDRVSIVLDSPANRAVVLAHDVQEGHMTVYESWLLDDDTGVTLAEIEGSGSHDLELLTLTPEQRDSVLIIVWADDPDAGQVGLPDCEEDGTRLQPDLDLYTSFHFPSIDYPLTWCGALLGS